MILPRKGYFCYTDVDGLQVYCYDTNGFTKHIFFRGFSNYLLDFIYNSIKSMAIGESGESPYGIYTAIFEINSDIKKELKSGKEVKDYIKLFTEGLEVSIFMPYLVNVGTYRFFQKTSFQYPYIENKRECFKLIFTPDKDMVKNMVSLIEEDAEIRQSLTEKEKNNNSKIKEV